VSRLAGRSKTELGTSGRSQLFAERDFATPRRVSPTDILISMAKVLLSLDDRLLRRIDAAAARRGMSRSGFIAALARRELRTELGPGATPAARDALRRLDRIFAGAGVGARETDQDGSTAALRAERDARSSG
jgi:hypothetical protein